MYVYLCGQLPFFVLCYLVMNDYVLRYCTQVFRSLVHGTAPGTRASTKPGTWNIPEHPGTSRNIPEQGKLSQKKEKKVVQKMLIVDKR